MKYKLRWFIQVMQIKTKLFFLQLFGYIDKDLQPLKCTCGSKELEDCNKDYIDNILVEFDVRCKKCGEILNHYVYGHWDWYWYI